MSSICGIIEFESKTVEFERLRRMGESMLMRGKDGSGAYMNRGVGFQHNLCRRGEWRSARDREPLAIEGEGNRYVAMLDGELRSIGEGRDISGLGGASSSAEALIESYIAWGHGCVEQLDGEFAFALYDESRREVLLARDPIGAKPLYYMKDGTKVVFASEIRGLLKYLGEGIVADRRAIEELVLAPTGLVSGADIYRGICELAPSSALICSRLGVQTIDYRQVRAKPRRACSAEVISPSCDARFADDGSLRALLGEALFAFGYPAFDEYMAGFLAALRSLQPGCRASVYDRSLMLDLAYALERADRFGVLCGVSVTPVMPAVEKHRRNSGAARLEKLLASNARLISSDADAPINRFFPDLLASVEAIPELRPRLRAYAKLIQLNDLLSIYRIDIV